MSCENHPNKETVATCQFCGKELCEDCSIDIAGRNYCENCMSELVGSELTDIATRKSSSLRDPENNLENQDPDLVNQEANLNNQETDLVNQENVNETPSQVAENYNPSENEQDDLYQDNRAYEEMNNIDKDVSRNGNQRYNNEPNQMMDSNNPVEERYEKYLDDLHYDEPLEGNQKNFGNSQTPPNKNLSLSEQLAEDESLHGSITKEPYVPDEPKPQEDFSTRNIPIMRNLKNVDDDKRYEETNEDSQDQYYSTLHGQQIHYKGEGNDEESLTNMEIVLTVILTILILFVILYVIFLLTLHSYYPNFFDAIIAFFTSPAETIDLMFS